MESAPGIQSPPVARVHILAERNMRWYFGTQLISLTGMMLRTSILSLFIIKAVGIEKAPPIIGYIGALNVLPGAFLSPFAGIIVDRFDKRNILYITAILGFLQALVLAMITLGDPHTVALWQIYAVMGFTGFTNMIDGICRNAMIKEAIVNEYNKEIGNRMFNSLYTIAMVIGNWLSGYCVLAIGFTNSFVLNGASFLVLIWGLLNMNFTHRDRHKVVHPPGWKGLTEAFVNGLRYMWQHPCIKLCISLTAAITAIGYVFNLMMTVIAKQMFGGGPTDYSYLAAMSGIGSVLGSLVAIAWSKRSPITLIMVTGCIIEGCCQLAASMTTHIHAGALAFAGSGFGFMLAFLPVRSAVNHLAKDDMVGKVLGVTFMCFYGGIMVSSVVAGYISKHFGCANMLYGCGLVLLAIAVMIPFLPGIKEIEK